jgi:hypothetical protein
MKIDSNNATQQSDTRQAERQQEMQEQRAQARQEQENQKRVEEASKFTGVGQHLDITS